MLELVQAEQQAAAAFRADMLFTDVDPGAFLLAATTGLPLASTYQDVLRHGISSLAWRRVCAAFAPVLRHYGLPARTPDELWFSQRVLKLIPSIPELDGADRARLDVCYVGHLLGDLRPHTDNTYQRAPGRRYVFLYVGTGALPQPSLRRVLPGDRSERRPGPSRYCVPIGWSGVKGINWGNKRSNAPTG